MVLAVEIDTFCTAHSRSVYSHFHTFSGFTCCRKTIDSSFPERLCDQVSLTTACNMRGVIACKCMQHAQDKAQLSSS